MQKFGSLSSLGASVIAASQRKLAKLSFFLFFSLSYDLRPSEL
jgi:hypothetical protein